MQDGHRDEERDEDEDRESRYGHVCTPREESPLRPLTRTDMGFCATKMPTERRRREPCKRSAPDGRLQVIITPSVFDDYLEVCDRLPQRPRSAHEVRRRRNSWCEAPEEKVGRPPNAWFALRGCEEHSWHQAGEQHRQAGLHQDPQLKSLRRTPRALTTVSKNGHDTCESRQRDRYLSNGGDNRLVFQPGHLLRLSVMRSDTGSVSSDSRPWCIASMEPERHRRESRCSPRR